MLSFGGGRDHVDFGCRCIAFDLLLLYHDGTRRICHVHVANLDELRAVGGKGMLVERRGVFVERVGLPAFGHLCGG